MPDIKGKRLLKISLFFTIFVFMCISTIIASSAVYPKVLRINAGEAISTVELLYKYNVPGLLRCEIVKPVKVIPGGHSIGVFLHSKGVIVVGMSDITERSGRTSNPARDAGIRAGDIIMSVNGEEVKNEKHMRDLINRCRPGSVMVLEINRAGRGFKANVKASICSETGRRRVGLFIRDSAAGVGTLSFYHPESRTYGALGHMITETDTSRRFEMQDGHIVEAAIRGINAGRRGYPGEKIGLFQDQGKVVGNIEKNTRYGIFGSMKTPVVNPLYRNSLPVALGYQVKKGPAEMLTVIEGTRIKKYAVEIQEVYYPWRNDGRGLIVKITDRELIERTGGIIQGMSGSPIIQNGRLAGIVTHVFINDPLRGYGLLAEWMIREAGLLQTGERLKNIADMGLPAPCLFISKNVEPEVKSCFQHSGTGISIWNCIEK